MELPSTSMSTMKPSEVEERSTTPTAGETNGTETTITKIPSWSQAEVASSQSAQRPIPPDEETKVFSWADVRDIVGMHVGSIFPKRIRKILFCESISEPRSAAMNTKTVSRTARNQPPRSHPAQTIRTRRLQSLVQRHHRRLRFHNSLHVRGAPTLDASPGRRDIGPGIRSLRSHTVCGSQGFSNLAQRLAVWIFRAGDHPFDRVV